MTIAIYAGSFDPMTNGHLWMIEAAARLFSTLHVEIGVNPAKAGRFDLDARLEMMRESIEGRGLSNVLVGSYVGQYLFRRAQDLGASHVVRGIRNAADFGYEYDLKQINDRIVAGIETVFLVAPPAISSISSSNVMGLIGPEGWEDIVRPLVPDAVFPRLSAWNHR